MLPRQARVEARREARQSGGMDTSIPELGDDLGLYWLVRRAIERVRAMDIPEADKQAWITYIEAQYQAARVVVRRFQPAVGKCQSGPVI